MADQDGAPSFAQINRLHVELAAFEFEADDRQIGQKFETWAKGLFEVAGGVVAEAPSALHRGFDFAASVIGNSGQSAIVLVETKVNRVGSATRSAVDGLAHVTAREGADLGLLLHDRTTMSLAGVAPSKVVVFGAHGLLTALVRSGTLFDALNDQRSITGARE